MKTEGKEKEKKHKEILAGCVRENTSSKLD
jgi:hypothetical protein